MRKMLNKRGVGAEEWLEQIPKIILTVAVMAGIFLIVNYYINISVNIKEVEREALFNRMMYSPNCIMYTDNITGTVYPGIIELSNFTDEALDNAIEYSSKRHIAAKLDLYDAQKQLVSTAYLNGVWFNRLEPLAKNRMIGASSAEIYTREIPIIYRKNNINNPGFLKVEILIPN